MARQSLHGKVMFFLLELSLLKVAFLSIVIVMITDAG